MHNWYESVVFGFGSVLSVDLNSPAFYMACACICCLQGVADKLRFIYCDTTEHPRAESLCIFPGSNAWSSTCAPFVRFPKLLKKSNISLPSMEPLKAEVTRMNLFRTLPGLWFDDEVCAML